MPKRAILVAVLLLLALAWWAAPDDVGVTRPERGSRVTASPDRSEPEARATKRARPRRPPLVIQPPSTDTAAVDPTFEVSVWFETKSGEHLPFGYVVGCGFVGPRFLSNGASIALADVPCTATGLVEDGFLVRRSAPAEIGPENGDVTFTFPDERTGGVGIQIRADERGILIESVLPGGPAEDLGLEPGDVVVAVEGKDAREISLDEFVETMTGPEGSDVEFVLRAGGDTGDDALETVKVARRFLGT
jgi:hypothetical protein